MSVNRLSQLPKDFDGLIDQLKEIIPELTNDWTDFSDGDLGMFLLKLFAGMKDMQNYHFDRQLRELFLPLLTQRSNLILLTKLFGYFPASYRCCRVQVTLPDYDESSSEYGVGAKLPLFSEFTLNTANAQVLTFTYLGNYLGDNKYELVQGVRKSTPISVDNSPFGDCLDLNGNIIRTVSQICVGTTTDKVAIDSTSCFTRTLDNHEFLLDELTESASLLKGASDPDILFKYQLFVDYDMKSYIKFFSIDETSLTVEGAQISLLDLTNVKFNILVTEGSLGRVSKGTVLSDVLNNEAPVIVEEVLSVGSDPISVEDAKNEIPTFVTTLDRTVTADDFIQTTIDFLFKNTNAKYREGDTEYSFNGLSYAVSVIDYYIYDHTALNKKPTNYQGQKVWPSSLYHKVIVNYAVDKGVFQTLPQYLATVITYPNRSNKRVHNVFLPLHSQSVPEPYKSSTTWKVLDQDTLVSINYELISTVVTSISGDQISYKYTFSNGSEFVLADQPRGENALVNYLNQKRMVGIQISSNALEEYSQSTHSFTHHFPVNVLRVFIRLLNPTSRSDKPINWNSIDKALSEYLPVSKDSYGRSITVSDILHIIYRADPHIQIAPSNIEIGVFSDDGETLTPIRDFENEDYQATLSDLVIYGGYHY